MHNINVIFFPFILFTLMYSDSDTDTDSVSTDSNWSQEHYDFLFEIFSFKVIENRVSIFNKLMLIYLLLIFLDIKFKYTFVIEDYLKSKTIQVNKFDIMYRNLIPDLEEGNFEIIITKELASSLTYEHFITNNLINYSLQYNIPPYA